MTEKLRTLLHERATAVDFTTPDVDALTKAGDRRLQRRGLIAGSATLAAAALVAGALASQLGGRDGRAGVAHDPVRTDGVTWATGSVIHTGGTSVDVGRQVMAYVRTSVGYVVANPDGGVWSVTTDNLSRVGGTDPSRPHLVADEDGTRVGWLDTSGDRPAFVVYDQATKTTWRFEEEPAAGAGERGGSDRSAYFYALDGDTAYWRDGRGTVAVDLRTREVRVVDLAGNGAHGINDVEDGRIAFATDQGTVVSGGAGDVLLPGAHGDLGSFSPLGTWYTQDADDPKVYAVRDGHRVSFGLGYDFATGYEWLDDSTVVMIARRDGHSPVELLRCGLPDATCTRVAELAPDFDRLRRDGVALPVGVPIEAD